MPTPSSVESIKLSASSPTRMLIQSPTFSSLAETIKDIQRHSNLPPLNHVIINLEMFPDGNRTITNSICVQ